MPTCLCLHSKGYCKFGNVITNAWLVFFNNSKALHWHFPHWKMLPLEIMVWIDVSTSKNECINCFKYYASSTKILSWIFFSKPYQPLHDDLHLEVSIFKSPPPIRYPKCIKHYCEKSYLDAPTFNASLKSLSHASNVIGAPPMSQCILVNHRNK